MPKIAAAVNSATIVVRMTPAEKKRIDKGAAKEKRSLNQFVLLAALEKAAYVERPLSCGVGR